MCTISFLEKMWREKVSNMAEENENMNNLVLALQQVRFLFFAQLKENIMKERRHKINLKFLFKIFSFNEFEYDKSFD